MEVNIEKTLHKVSGPSRYIGGEYNSHKKNWQTSPLKIVLIYPDLYEIGMSNFGHLLLYHLINETTPYLAERAYAPFLDMEENLRTEGLPLFSLESRRALADFDVVGFSLQYELTFTNVLNMLDLGGIPLYQQDRREEDPLVIGGGPLTTYAEALTPFFDLYFIGEAEEGLLEILERIATLKKQQTPRNDILLELSKIEGVYIPSFYEETYDNQGCFAGIKPKVNYSGIHGEIKRRIIRNLDNSYYPLKQIVPFRGIVHDRGVIELFRGCYRGCRFCLAGYIYRPVRFRGLEQLKSQSLCIIENSGYDTLGLTSFNSTDYPQLKALIEFLKSSFKDRVTLSLPSLGMRPASVELAQISDNRRTNLTFAPEAATKRLRQVINKNITDEDIHNTVREAARRGMDLMKLYFMIGLPTETEEDIAAIVSLAKELYLVAKTNRTSKRPFHFNITISPFVPKPHTPFAREKQLPLSDCYEKINFLKNHLTEPNFTLREHDPLMSFLEGVFGRGDRKLHQVIYRAFKKGARFDAWDEHLKISNYLQAFSESNIDPQNYLSARSGILPWDIINCGVSPQILLQERDKAQRAEESDGSLFTDI